MGARAEALSLAALLLLGCPSADLAGVDFACAGDEDCPAAQVCLARTGRCAVPPVVEPDGGAPPDAAGPRARAATPWELVGLAQDGEDELRLYASGRLEREDTSGRVVVGAVRGDAAEVLGLAARGGELYVWYLDGSHSRGDDTALDARAPRAPWGDPLVGVVGIDLDPAGRVQLYAADGTTRSTTLDGAAAEAPRPYTVPEGKRPEDLAELALDPLGQARSAFHDGTRAEGEARALASRSIRAGQPVAMTITLTHTYVLYGTGYMKRYEGLLGAHFRPQAPPWTGDWRPPASGARRWTGQYVRLPAGRTPEDVVALAFDAQRDVFHVWLDGGQRVESAGLSIDGAYELVGLVSSTTVTTHRLIDTSIAADDRLFRWYDTGRRYVGTLDSLGTEMSSALPRGRRWSEVRALDFEWPSLDPANGLQFTWALYDDGALSRGLSTDLDYRGYCTITSTTPCSLADE